MVVVGGWVRDRVVSGKKGVFNCGVTQGGD